MAGELTGVSGWGRDRLRGDTGMPPLEGEVTGASTTPRPNSTGATKANNYNGLGLPPKAGNFQNRPGGIGSPYIPPGVPAAPTLPPMPFNFNASASATGSGGAGGGSGTGAGGTGTGTGGGAAPSAADARSSFTGSKSTELLDTFGKANDLYANAPDMLERNLMKARDSAFNETKALGEFGTLAGGRTSPRRQQQILDNLNRNSAGAAVDSAVQRFGMQLGAAGLAGDVGGKIAGDLRSQEGNNIAAYNSTTRAWEAANANQIAREQMANQRALQSQQMAMQMYQNMFGVYSGLLNNFFPGGGMF